MNFFYTGIGSRQTPENICDIMTDIASRLSGQITLRSGGADGADDAFERGCNMDCEIYIPWKNFNGRTHDRCIIVGEDQTCLQIASEIHPKWIACKRGARLLHARNVCQILGRDPNNPTKSLFVLAYTENGELKGGTSTALKLAALNNIPIFNFGKILHLPEDMIIQNCEKFILEVLDLL